MVDVKNDRFVDFSRFALLFQPRIWTDPMGLNLKIVVLGRWIFRLSQSNHCLVPACVIKRTNEGAEAPGSQGA